MTGATLFSGIGAPEMAMPEWRWIFHAEIEAFPSAVMGARHPESINLGDVTAHDFCDRALAIGRPDVIVFGSPCQSYSVAGKRLGLDDPRGNLALIALGIVRRLEPRWFVFENVPGLLSSGEGADFKVFLDLVEDIRYVADVDIVDAQFCGLAQRRRRVFVCAQSADSILRATTTSSALTIAQCLSETLLLILAALSDRSVIDSSGLAFDASTPVDSLRRRMRLFGLGSAEAASRLPLLLAALRRSSDHGPSNLDSDLGSDLSRTFVDTESRRSNVAMEPWRAACLSIEPSWSDILAVASEIQSGSITSTAGSETTNRRIYMCAQAMLHITALITPSRSCSPVFWRAALSVSTALRAFTNYARSAGSSLFTDVEWVRPWNDFIGQAEPAGATLGNLRGQPFDSSELLPLAESLCGHPPSRGEKREDVTGTIASRTSACGGLGTDFDLSGGVIAAFGGNNQSGPIDIATARSSSSSPHGRLDFESETFITHAPVAMFSVNARQDPDSLAELTGPIDTDGHSQAIAFQSSQSGVRQVEAHATLDANNGSRRHNGVRRLMPVECERLQGFPDHHTAISYRGKPAKDGPRYKAIGNSMAVTVVRWILRRVQAVDAYRP